MLVCQFDPAYTQHNMGLWTFHTCISLFTTFGQAVNAEVASLMYDAISA
jgi:hypothetical protein